MAPPVFTRDDITRDLWNLANGGVCFIPCLLWRHRSCAPGTAVPLAFLGVVDIYDRRIVSPVWRKGFHSDYICSEISQDCSRMSSLPPCTATRRCHPLHPLTLTLTLIRHISLRVETLPTSHVAKKHWIGLLFFIEQIVILHSGPSRLYPSYIPIQLLSATRPVSATPTSFSHSNPSFSHPKKLQLAIPPSLSPV